jgi:hypothetical protein
MAFFQIDVVWDGNPELHALKLPGEPRQVHDGGDPTECAICDPLMAAEFGWPPKGSGTDER